MRYSEPGENEETPREQLQTAQALDEDTGLKVARYKPGDVIIPVKSYRMLRLKFTLCGAGCGSLTGFIASLFAPDLLGEDWLMWCFSLGALIGYCAGYFRAVVIEFKEGLKESS